MTNKSLFVPSSIKDERINVSSVSEAISKAAFLLATHKNPDTLYWKKPYQFYGRNKEFFESKEQVVVLSGPAETGKSICALSLVFKLCLENDGARVVISRKVREDMGNTVIQAIRDDIVSSKLDNRSLHVYYVNGKQIKGRMLGGERPTHYQFTNGSIIFFVGLDKPGKVLSGAFNIILVNQGEEINETDYQLLTTRITGRGTVKLKDGRPNQLLLDCNPAHSDHFIKQKEESGELTIFHSRHIDNPSLYNQETGEITEQGKTTLDVLSKLTGVHRERYYLGKWVMAEGLFFKNFNPESHGQYGLADDLDFENGRICLSMDYGFIHSNVVLFHLITGEYRYTFDEIITQELHPEDIAPLIHSKLESYGIASYTIYRFRVGHDAFAKGRAKKTVVQMYRDLGFNMVRAFTDPGSRVAGTTAFLQWLGRPLDDNPIMPTWFYDRNNCPTVEKAFLKLVHAKNNSEDIEKVDSVEDDVWDCLRYGLVTKRTLRGGRRIDIAGQIDKESELNKKRARIEEIKEARRKKLE